MPSPSTAPPDDLRPSPHARRLSGWPQRAGAGRRQLAALAVATLAVGLVAALRPQFLGANAETLPLVAWCGYAWTNVVLVLALAWGCDAAATRRRAQRNDPGAALLSVLVLVAACASLVAVILAVQSAHALQGPTRWTHLALAMGSLAGSWLLIQCAFALRYARLYYRPTDDDGTHHGGLAFPGEREPDYLDFLYQAIVIGMTSQTSDVAITQSRMRVLALVHGLLSFAFNLIVLALAINVVASALV